MSLQMECLRRRCCSCCCCSGHC